jgi:hypothetical protein
VQKSAKPCLDEHEPFGRRGGCSTALSTKVAPNAMRVFSAQVRLHDEALTLNLASPQTPLSAATPLVLYASGDGGRARPTSTPILCSGGADGLVARRGAGRSRRQQP